MTASEWNARIEKARAAYREEIRAHSGKIVSAVDAAINLWANDAMLNALKDDAPENADPVWDIHSECPNCHANLRIQFSTSAHLGNDSCSTGFSMTLAEKPEPQTPGAPASVYLQEKPRRMRGNPTKAGHHGQEHAENADCDRLCCEPVDAPEPRNAFEAVIKERTKTPWNETPECWDEVEIEGKTGTWRVAFAEGNSVVVFDIGSLSVFHKSACRVVRKAELRVRDFVQVRNGNIVGQGSTGVVGAIGEGEARVEFLIVGGILYLRSQLILLHRGAGE